MARHGGSDFSAYGNADYVAGAALGQAIGEAVRTQADFNDCMVASGWRIADGADTETASPPLPSGPVYRSSAYSAGKSGRMMASAVNFPVAAMSRENDMQIILPVGWQQYEPSQAAPGLTIYARNQAMGAELARIIHEG